VALLVQELEFLLVALLVQEWEFWLVALPLVGVPLF
jgi:hypothetical protein